MKAPFFIYEVTPRCNNDCLYCYNVWKENKNYPNGKLNLEEIRRLFEKNFQEFTPEGITLTGGEPLLHPEILEIVSFFYSKGIELGIATNGILLDEETVKRLVEQGIDYFEISLVSINQEIYASLSQNNQLKKVKQAILNVKKHRAKLTVSLVITKLNLAVIEEVIDLCFAFSVDWVALNRFVPGGNGMKNISELQIKKEELMNVLFMANNKAKEYNMPINITVPIESCIIDHQEYPHLNFGTCVCGKNKWVIDPIGNLRTCEQNPEILGNLLEDNFFNLSRLKVVESFRNNTFKDSCDICGRFSFCGGGCRILRN